MRIFHLVFKELVLLFNRLALVFGKRNAVCILGFWVILSGLSVFPAGFNIGIDQYFMDFTARLAAPSRTPASDTVILAIDMETLSRTPHRWPWPRRMMIRLLAAVASQSPQLVVFDILFQHPEADGGSPDDLQFAQLIRQLGNVALVSTVEESLTPQGRELQKYYSHDLFRQAAKINGFVWAVHDSDGTIRSCILADDRLSMESCALQAARQVNPGQVTISKLSSGTTRGYFAFAEGQGGIPIIPAQEFLDGHVSGDLLKNKIVFVGVTAQALHDFHQTAMGVIPGVVLLATSFDSILCGRTGYFYNAVGFRLLMAIIGGMIGVLLFSAAASYSLFWSVFSIVAFCCIGLAGCEMTGRHLPFGPSLSAWFFVTLFLFASKYLLDLLKIQFMQAEAQAAGQIQKALFPESAWKGPNGFSCVGLCHPCNETGGDYYDYYQQPDGSLVFMIGDVSGHGFSAALITTMAKTICTILQAWEMMSPVNLLVTINQVLFTLMKRKKLMTAFVGHLDPQTGVLTVSSGGHLPAFHVDTAHRLTELGRPALPLGAKKTVPANTQELILNPGEGLVLYTDGIVEALDWQGRQYTFKTWEQEVQEKLPSFSRNPDLESLLEGVRKHTAGRPFDDDVTIMVLYRDIV